MAQAPPLAAHDVYHAARNLDSRLRGALMLQCPILSLGFHSRLALCSCTVLAIVQQRHAQQPLLLPPLETVASALRRARAHVNVN